MKTLKNIILRVIMSSGLFLNATAQDDITGLRIPGHFQENTELNYSFANIVNNSNNCCGYADADKIEKEEEKMIAAENRSWIENQHTITITDLPKGIIKALIKEYDVYAVLQVVKIETSVREAYKLRIVKNDEQWDIFITRKGDILMEEKIAS